MYLSQLHVEGFRSVRAADVDFARDVTVLVGENNGGKSNVIDALTLLTDPLDGRRMSYLDSDDLFRGPGQTLIVLRASYTGTPEELAPYQHAMTPEQDKAVYELRYTPAVLGQLRGQVIWVAGTGADPTDPVPAGRERLRHVYLPALRDAVRELGSGAGGRVRVILESLLSDHEHVGDEAGRKITKELLLEFVGGRLKEVEDYPVVREAARRVESRLSRLTNGAYPQENRLGFDAASLQSLARGLRSRMADAGMDPRDVAESGMGYANLLYISTVLAQLHAATQADLTLLLVEEPEAHLHPPLQALLVDYLREAAANSREPRTDHRRWNGHIQVVISSHAPSLSASTPIRDVVVLQRRQVEQNTASDPVVGTEATPADDLHGGPAPEYARFESAVINVAGVGMSKSAENKLNRYLNATRSTLLFSPRVLLVEGIGEAVLLPVMANQMFAKGTLERSRFVGTVLVPIDGVDFVPYVELLLTAVGGQRIGHRVAIVTDLDSQNDSPDKGKTGAQRVAELWTQIATLDAANHGQVFCGATTLESELLAAGNADPIWTAWSKQQPRAWKTRKAEIDALGEHDRAVAFAKKLKDANIRKGDFAQDLIDACDLARTDLRVPTYLADAIRWVCE